MAAVEDVAAGHLLAAEKGRIGERYILGARNMTLRANSGRACGDYRASGSARAFAARRCARGWICG